MPRAGTRVAAGQCSAYFLQKRPDLQITGIDLAPEMIRQAERKQIQMQPSRF
jgi:trans-aconitate methyltransferase